MLSPLPLPPVVDERTDHAPYPVQNLRVGPALCLGNTVETALLIECVDLENGQCERQNTGPRLPDDGVGKGKKLPSWPSRPVVGRRAVSEVTRV